MNLRGTWTRDPFKTVDIIDTMFNDMWRMIPKVSTFPAVNIVRESDGKYRIDMTVAGFSRDDIEVYVDEGHLTVKGDVKKAEEDYIVKGIAERAFTKTFPLTPALEVTGVTLEDGILSIFLNAVEKEDSRKRLEIS